MRPRSAILAVLYCFSARTVAHAQTTHHVALCGNDSWTGLSATCAAPNGPKRTIQAAIDASVHGDTVLVADGTYTGPGNRDIDFGGRNITLRSKNGPAACSLDAQATQLAPARHFYFHSGENRAARVEGFALTGGSAGEGVPGERNGGAVLVNGASPTIVNCLMIDNGAPIFSYQGTLHGGAIAVAAGHPLILECSLANNRTAERGGAIWVQGEVTAKNCLITANFAATHGGAIASSAGSVHLFGCEITANYAYYRGGAVDGDGMTLEVADCNISDNMADKISAIDAGDSEVIIRDTLIANNTMGPPAAYAAIIVSGRLVMHRCAVVGNQKGGLSCTGELLLSECLLAGNGGWNHAPTAVNAPDANVLIRGCTITRHPGFAGALGLSSTATITNSIVWGNNAGQIAGTPLLKYCNVAGNYPGFGNIAVDPLFVDPLGPLVPESFRLLPGSPCVDRGSNADVTPGVTLDLAGNPRFLDDPGSINLGAGTSPIVDIGAFEFTGVSCYPDCTAGGALTIADYACFQSRFASADLRADCDVSGALTIADFACFRAAFAAGCP